MAGGTHPPPVKFTHVLPSKIAHSSRSLWNSVFYSVFIFKSLIYMESNFCNLYTHMEFLHRVNFYSFKIPVNNGTNKNSHRSTPQYWFKFSYSKIGPPRKMTSTIILGLPHCFWGSNFRRFIFQNYTNIFVFKMISFIDFHQQYPP